jgi:hypothetical protein
MSSLIRSDLLPMIVGYVLIMGALAIGLRTVQRSGKAAAGATAGAAADGRTTRPAPPPDQVTGPAPAGGVTSRAPAGRVTGPASPSGRVTSRARLRAIARPEPGWRRLAVFSLGTAVGGYLVLMAVVVAYYYGVGVAHGGNFVQSAFTGCAMLLGLAAPVFIALSWLTARKGWRL